jgi:PAS domain S-box-containing protein
MKPRPSRTVLWSSVIALTLASAAFFLGNYNWRVDKSRVYRIGWEDDPPYEQKAEDGGPTGLAVELVREAAARRGIRLEWVWQPGSSENALRKNLVDLWPLMTITGARKGLIYFTDPYFQHDHGLLVRAESSYQQVGDLAHARVARSELPIDRQMVHRILPRSIEVSRPVEKDAIDDVCRGSADAAFVEEFAAASLMLDGTSCSGQRLRLVWIEEFQTKLAIGSTFAASAVADDLRQGIGDLAKDGGLPQLLSRWGHYSPRNLQNMIALINAKHVEGMLIGTIALLALLLGLALFAANRLWRQKDRIRSLQADVARRDSEDRFRNMADCAPVMVWASGDNGDHTFFNKEWLAFTGRTMEQEVGSGWTASVHPDDLDLCLSAYNSAFAARRDFRIDFRLRRADGAYRAVLDHGVPRFEAGQVFAGFVGGCIDITELKQAQEENLARQKLESVGRLAGGIAHDFNNLLGGVLAHAELAAEELASGLKPDEELERIRGVAIRGAEIVRQLMIYAGQESGELEVVDVSGVVSEIVQLLRVSVSKHAILKTDMEQDLGGVRAHPAQLRQLIMNLVSNASDAIGQTDGVIHVTTKRKIVTADSRVNNGEVLPEGEYVQLCVSDTGAGIPPEVQARVFDPFFTTKVGGHGHGLGLAVVQGIVRSLGGATSIRSARDRGTTFEILLPCASETTRMSEGSDKTAPVAEVRDPKRGILVVEDEDALRAAVSKLLRMRGFPVMEAGDGTAAVALLHSPDAQIALVLLDVTLPGKPSHEVFEEARALGRGVKVIVTSAYGPNVVAGFFPGAQLEYFIRKPYRLGDLVELVRTVLSGENAHAADG